MNPKLQQLAEEILDKAHQENIKGIESISTLHFPKAYREAALQAMDRYATAHSESVQYFKTRPKSLSGIENNNGWVKIEPDGSNLPDSEMDVHIVFTREENKLHTFGVWDNRLQSFWSGAMKITTATHYQPIEKPEPPLY